MNSVVTAASLATATSIAKAEKAPNQFPPVRSTEAQADPIHALIAGHVKTWEQWCEAIEEGGAEIK